MKSLVQKKTTRQPTKASRPALKVVTKPAPRSEAQCCAKTSRLTAGCHD